MTNTLVKTNNENLRLQTISSKVIEYVQRLPVGTEVTTISVSKLLSGRTKNIVNSVSSALSACKHAGLVEISNKVPTETRARFYNVYKVINPNASIKYRKYDNGPLIHSQGRTVARVSTSVPVVHHKIEEQYEFNFSSQLPNSHDTQRLFPSIKFNKSDIRDNMIVIARHINLLSSQFNLLNRMIEDIKEPENLSSD